MTPHAISLVAFSAATVNSRGALIDIAGIILELSVPTPASYNGLHVLVELTQGRGTVEVQVRVSHRDAPGIVLYDQPWRCAFIDPFDIIQLWRRLPPLTIPGPGPYVVEVLHNGVPISSRRIIIRELKLQEPFP